LSYRYTFYLNNTWAKLYRLFLPTGHVLPYIDGAGVPNIV